MGILIKNIFGKEEELTKNDIYKCIIEARLKESAQIEYKSVDKLHIDNRGRLLDSKGIEDKKEEIIIKPLVAFLNKFSSEGGVLILGIKDKNHLPVELVPAEPKIFTPERLRNWISNYISTIPSTKDSPDIEIKNIDVNGKIVTLIEVHPKDFNTVYFSRLTNDVYIRKNDESVLCTLDETMRMTEEKIIAKVFVDLKVIEKEEIDENWVKYQIEFQYINEGNKPGEWVRLLLEFQMKQGTPADIQIQSLPAPGYWKPVGSLKAFSSGFQQDSYTKDVIYSKGVVGYKIGKLEIKIAKTALAEMIINTFEYKGFMSQVFSISAKEINEITREFRSYISL